MAGPNVPYAPVPYAPGFQPGPATGTSATISPYRADTSVYFQAWSQDPQQFAMTAGTFFDALKKANTIRPDMTDYSVLQAMVRKLGMSKGTGPLGQTDFADISAISEVFKSSYLDDTDWYTWLDRKSQSPYATVGGSTFSKDVSTALKKIDSTDAESILSNAYYKNFGSYPSAKQIENFKTKYNAEAQRQMSTTTTTASGTTTGTSSSGKRNVVESGQGFTQAEYDTFLAQYLASNYKITGKEESGAVKTIIDNIKRVYKDNMLPEPPLDEIASFATSIIGTGDATAQQQKVDLKLQSVRDVAAKMYPGLADALAAGTDVKTYADPVVQSFNNYLGTNIDKTDSRVNQVLNYYDGKTTRSMNATEMQNFFERQPEFGTSDAGRAKYMRIAQAAKDAING
jgi:hypothetical protein